MALPCRCWASIPSSTTRRSSKRPTAGACFRRRRKTACCCARRRWRCPTAAESGCRLTAPSTKPCAAGSPRACRARRRTRPTLDRIAVEPAEHVHARRLERATASAGALFRRLGARRHAADRLSVERSRRRVGRERAGDSRHVAGRSDADGPLHEPHRHLEHGHPAGRHGRRRALRPAAAAELHRRPRLGQAANAGHRAEPAGQRRARFCARVSWT